MSHSNHVAFVKARCQFPELTSLQGYRACIAKHFPNRYCERQRNSILAGCRNVTNRYKTFSRLVAFGIPKEGVYFGKLYKNPLETYRGYHEIYFVVTFGRVMGFSKSIEELYELVDNETTN